MMFLTSYFICFLSIARVTNLLSIKKVMLCFRFLIQRSFHINVFFQTNAIKLNSSLFCRCVVRKGGARSHKTDKFLAAHISSILILKSFCF